MTDLSPEFSLIARTPALNTIALHALDNLAHRVAPRPLREWAEAERRIASGPHAGIFSADYQPACREILDEYSSREVEEIILLSAVQMFKTETLLNILFYHINEDPADLQFVVPDTTLARDLVKKRIDPAAALMPELEARLQTRHIAGRRKPQSLLQRTFPNGSLTVLTALGRTAWDSRTPRVILVDEADKINDPAIRQRARDRLLRHRYTGRGAKLVIASTTSELETSVIWQLWNEGSGGEYHARCPNCDRLDKMEWDSNVTFEFDRKELPVPDSARYYCSQCRADWTDEDRVAAIDNGAYIHARPTQKARRSFRVNRLADPYVRVRDIVEDYREGLAAIKQRVDYEPHRVFINQTLARPWADDQFRIDADDIQRRTIRGKRDSETGRALLHPNTQIIVTSVDIQADRIEAEVAAWGWSPTYKTAWRHGLQYRVIDIPPSNKDSWRELDKIQLLRWRTDEPTPRLFNGSNITVIDSRYQIDHVREYIIESRDGSRHAPWPVYPISGVERTRTDAGIYVTDPRPEWGNSWRPMIDTNLQKNWIFSQLKADIRRKGEHILSWFADGNYNYDYFAGLLSEHRVLVTRQGRGKYIWRTKRDGIRNEPLDLLVYSKGAMELWCYRFALSEGYTKQVAYDWTAVMESLHNSRLRDRAAAGETVNEKLPPNVIRLDDGRRRLDNDSET